MNEKWDKVNNEQCAIDRKMLRDIHLAVCGDEQLGVTGLVSDVRDLKQFRRKIELRVATVAGGVTILVMLAKAAWEKIKL